MVALKRGSGLVLDPVGRLKQERRGGIETSKVDDGQFENREGSRNAVVALKPQLPGSR